MSFVFSVPYLSSGHGQWASLTAAVEGNNHFSPSAGCHRANAAPCAVGMGYSIPAAGLRICPCRTSLGLCQPTSVARRSPSEGTNSGYRGITIFRLYFTALFSMWLDFFSLGLAWFFLLMQFKSVAVGDVIPRHGESVHSSSLFAAALQVFGNLS